MRILLACLLTVLVECPFLALFGYRSAYALTVTVCANVLTNLALNVGLRLLPVGTPAVVLAGELCVLAAEFGIYAYAFGRSARLFLLTLSANLLSFLIGLFVF